LNVFYLSQTKKRREQRDREQFNYFEFPIQKFR